MCVARNFRLEDQVIQFFTGLSDTFSMVETQIFLLDHLPSINKVYSLVVQEKSNNNVISVSTSFDDSSIIVNAYEARKLFGLGKGSSGSSNTEHPSR